MYGKMKKVFEKNLKKNDPQLKVLKIRGHEILVKNNLNLDYP